MGKLKPRADGLYYKQIYLGNGKYKSVYAATIKEVEEKALDLKIALRKGIDVSSANDTFEYWYNVWLKIKKSTVQESTYVKTVSNAKHLESLFHFPLSKLRPINIQTLLIDMVSNREVLPSQYLLKSVRGIVKQVFDLAISNRVIEFNPASSVVIPKTVKPRETVALSHEQQKWILGTEHRAKTAAMIMLFAGLRTGELIPLMWSDINLGERTVTISKSVERISSTYILKDTTKSKAGLRKIDIPKILSDYLSSVSVDSLLVTTNVKGAMHNQSSWTRMWESYQNELNIINGDFSHLEKLPTSKFDPSILMVIDKIRPHMLRHTFVTNMYYSGVDLKKAIKQVGHADVKTLLSIYAHLDDEQSNVNEKQNSYFEKRFQYK